MCLLHSNFRKIEGKCERVRTHGASPERLKPNNPMSYIYWFMPLILPVSNDIIIQLNICASVSVCVCVQTASNLFILLMCTWNKFLWNWKHIRMRWNCAAELAGMWVGGRTNERSFIRSIHVFRKLIHFMLYRMYRMCTDGALGLGQEKIFVWRFYHVCHIVYSSFYVTQFGSHHSQSSCPCQFRCCVISSSVPPNIVIFFMNIWLCARFQVLDVYEEKRGNFSVYIFSWFWSISFQK